MTTAVVTGVALLSTPSGAAPAVVPTALSQPVVVATGLDNPRQLSLLGTDLYIAEAGRGGTECSEDGCVGTTGAVAKVTQAYRARSATPSRVVTGLLSSAAPDGTFAVGSDGVSAVDLGRVYVAMTYAPPDLLPAPLPGAQAGKLLLNRLGKTTVAADISAVEIGSDPDGQGVDSNPYAVLALPGRQLVADAAGNTIIEVRAGQAPRVFAVLPEHDGNQAVPTSLAVGRDGTIYVGELNGENPGTARVDMLSPTGELIGHVDGFTTISGVAVGADGTLYVSELFGGPDDSPCVGASKACLLGGPAARRAAGGVSAADIGTPGQVTTVRPDGSRSSRPVPFPAGLAVDPAGHLFVSAFSVLSGDDAEFGGQVWRLS
ncbi:MAG TPA: ScyD/ScyE family protein [Mycobacteriales bacterium]|nr:ScyD/ScyE family protein [Mycobacteriales bacterium]